jgi:hypothetical protein
MTRRMERRLLYISVLHIDANLINARQKLGAVNQLVKWSRSTCPVLPSGKPG